MKSLINRIAFGWCIALALVANPAYAHRSGCHRWHSCPSDHGTYICGDTGHCSACPDNEFCKGGMSRTSSSEHDKEVPKPMESVPPAK